jgi:proline iminopeptidase
MIDVGETHQLYAQLWGNATAEQTIIFLHGGPGSGCSDSAKLLFNPDYHRVVFFDQRGTGKSRPEGLIEHNTTDDLVADINKVAAAFSIENFVLVGGSWGSCLALAYGLKNPERVIRMVLRGIFTARQSEIDFVDKGHVRAFFPEVWDRFAASVPTEFADDPGRYHQKQMFAGNQAATDAAIAYNQYEGALVTLDDRNAELKPFDIDTFNPTKAIIETHYLINNCFLEEDYIITNAAKLTMPIALVQGRYDMVCPPFTAYELHQALPNSQLYWTVAGHVASDRGNFDTVKALLADIN